MMDNAPYHTSSSSMKLYSELNMPILFTGPHTYSGSPIELFLATFKSAEVNPNRVKTGKR